MSDLLPSCNLEGTKTINPKKSLSAYVIAALGDFHCLSSTISTRRDYL